MEIRSRFFSRAKSNQPLRRRVVKEKHLVLRLRQRNYHARAIFFDGASMPCPPPPWDVAFRIHADEYEGEMRLQIHVQASARRGADRMMELSQTLEECEWIPRARLAPLAPARD